MTMKNRIKQEKNMYQEVSQLLMYGDLDREGILYQLGELFERYEKGV